MSTLAGVKGVVTMSVRALIAVLLLALLPSVARGQTTIEYYHLDALGSVRVITDQTGAVLERHDYLPFGEEWNPTPTTATDPRKFTGKERDTETGYDYFGARYLSAKTGRFTSVDPVYALSANLADPQLWNRYTYVRNNPLRLTDPDGRCIWDLCIVETAAVSIGVVEASAATAAAGAWFLSPPGRRSTRALANSAADLVTGTGQLITQAVDGLDSWFRSVKRPGTLGKPDHQVTAEEEATRIGGRREVTIDTTGGKKNSRRADAAVVDPESGRYGEIVQVYRPTPRGNIPQREKDAAGDIEKATGVKPTMVPVRQ